MRTPITLKIKFKSSSLEQFIERYSVDVSRGGIFIRTKEPLPVGTTLRFEFQLQDSSSLIGGEGTVVWNRAYDPGRTGVAPGMGVRFDKLTQDSQRVLERILNEKHRRGEAQLESRFDAGVRASREARSQSHEFQDSGTPLPAPAPGLAGLASSQSAGGMFGDEPTKMMAADQVNLLAQAMQKPEDFGNDQPTRRATMEEVNRAMRGEGSGPSRTGRTSEQVRLGSGISSTAVTRQVGPAGRSNPSLQPVTGIRPAGSALTPEPASPQAPSAPSLSTRQIGPGEVDALIAATASTTPPGSAPQQEPSPSPSQSRAPAQASPLPQAAPVDLAASSRPSQLSGGAQRQAPAAATPIAKAAQPPAATFLAPADPVAAGGHPVEPAAAAAPPAAALLDPVGPTLVGAPLPAAHAEPATLITPPPAESAAFAQTLVGAAPPVRDQDHPFALSGSPASAPEAPAAPVEQPASQASAGGRSPISISLPAVDVDLSGPTDSSPAMPLKPEDFAPPGPARPPAKETPTAVSVPELAKIVEPVSVQPTSTGPRTPWLVILLLLALVAAAAAVLALYNSRTADEGRQPAETQPPPPPPVPQQALKPAVALDGSPEQAAPVGGVPPKPAEPGKEGPQNHAEPGKAAEPGAAKIEPKKADEGEADKDGQPAAQPAPHERLIEVLSTPKGAEVLVDGKKVGKTPFVLKKIDTSKLRQIEVRKSGYTAQTRNVSDTESFTLKNGKEVLTLNLTLEQAPPPTKKDKEKEREKERESRHKAEAAKEEADKADKKDKAEPKAAAAPDKADKADKADQAPEAPKPPEPDTKAAPEPPKDTPPPPPADPAK